jgi:predicted Zn-dependent protease
MRHAMRLRAAPLLAVASLVAGCAVNPVTGQRQLALITEAQEIEMGRQTAEQAVRSMGLVDDPALQQYITTLGQALARESERPALPWSFQVVDDPTPNAFAAPGGFIFITRGLLGMMRNEAELVSVLGHEIGHVTARHSVTLISRAQIAQIGLGVGAVLSPTIARLGDLAGGGLSLLFLHYGRDAERQADDLGFRYMTEQGYDPRQMVNVFAALQRSGELSGQSPLPSWLASHPNPGERMQRIQQQIAQVPQDLDRTRVGTDDYMARLEGLVFGVNPRNGFFRDGQFLHPDLRFQMSFPQGWQTQNMAQAVLAGSPQQDALIQLTLAAGTPDQAANAFFGQQGVASERVSRQTINGLSAVTGYFRARTEQGELGGFAGFISLDNRTYQVLAYTPVGQLGRYDQVFRSVVGSFARLTDPQALAAQPNRITVVRVTEPMTLAQFNQRFPSQIPIEELALINQLEGPTAQIPANYRMKRVIRGG